MSTQRAVMWICLANRKLSTSQPEHLSVAGFEVYPFRTEHQVGYHSKNKKECDLYHVSLLSCSRLEIWCYGYSRSY